MRILSLAHLTAIDLPPDDLIEAAAAAGFDAVGLRLLRVTNDSPGYPLTEGTELMRRTQAALSNTGLVISDIEFIKITREIDISTLLPMLDAGASLGAKHVITAPYDDDLTRLADTLGLLSEASQERGIKTVLEFFPWTPVPDLSSCWGVVQSAGNDVGVLVDALHFDRSGSSHELLASIPKDRLPFAHICDATVLAEYTDEQLIHTARDHRLIPGAGEIDLVSFLTALPKETPLGIEVPMPKSDTQQTTTERLAILRNAAVSIVERAGANIRACVLNP